MRTAIITDTSCLIILSKIGELELLRQIFGYIFITDIIKNEFNFELPSWIKVENPKNINFQKQLSNFLDEGEASAIALAMEKENPIIIIDDAKGRNFAKSLNIKIAGTLSIFIEAKKLGIISNVKPYLELIKKTNFRFSEIIERKILQKAGEL